MAKVLLKQDVPNVGKAGDVRAVADGYARNYLIPRGMAVLATPGIVAQTEVRQEVAARRQARVQKEVQELAGVLGPTTLTFHVRAGDNEQLYGAITSADIAEELEKRLGRAIDRRHIELKEPIRRLGSYRVPVRLGDGAVPRIGVVVVQRQEE